MLYANYTRFRCAFYTAYTADLSIPRRDLARPLPPRFSMSSPLERFVREKIEVARRDGGATLGTLFAGAVIGWVAGLIQRRFRERQYISFDGDDGDAGFTAGSFSVSSEETKLIFCVRTDLKMSKGKISAQVGHATLGAYKAARAKTPSIVRAWENSAQPKIALAIKSAKEANTLSANARRLGIPTYTVHDAGRTQIAAGSMTVLAIGPAPNSKIDRVTGHLRLL